MSAQDPTVMADSARVVALEREAARVIGEIEALPPTTTIEQFDRKAELMDKALKLYAEANAVLGRS